MRRDQILREKEAAKTAAAPIPPRVDGLRSFPPDRNHNLPNRPEAPFPSRTQLERHPPLRHGDRRDGRDLRFPEPGRLDRPGDRPRDFQGNDRRGIEPTPRDFGRPSDRDRDRVRPEPPPRWTADSARENQERAGNAPWGSDQSGRLSRESGMPPPRTSVASTDRAEKLPPVSAERQEFLNAERAPFISTPPRAESPRRLREDPRDRSRTQSPRRYVSERDHQDPRHDERPGRHGPADPYNQRTRPEEIQPPAGPRSDRPADRPGEWGASDRPRDASAFQPAQLPPRAMDPNHGRLNSSSRQQPDPNFGRLNPAPAGDIPSGPRDRNLNVRGNRMVSAPQTHRDSRLAEAPRPPTPPEIPVPTGPSSARHPRRAVSGQLDATPGAQTTPSTSTAAGVHPDRLRHLGHTAPPPEAQQQPPSEASPAGIHPDRLRAFTNDGPAPPGAQPDTNRPRPPVSSVVTQGPPSRPKGSLPSPISAGGSGLPAPTGPASATERSIRGGRRQLAGINTMLQQAGQQNTPERMNVRGRGARMGGESFSGPSTPVAPTPPNLGRQDSGRQDLGRQDLGRQDFGRQDSSRQDLGRQDLGRQDLSRQEPGRPEPNYDLMNPPRADLVTSGPSPMDHRERGGGRHDRSSRHRHTSRSPAREAKPRPGDDAGYREHREHRERKDSNRNEERPSSRDIPGEREAPRRGERDSHDWAGGERGGRRDMRDDRRRGSRDDGGAGRKRKSEEGMVDRGHDKRARR
jgi:THO complex subunit 2